MVLFAELHQFWPHKFVRSKMMSLGGREPDIFMSHVIDSGSIDELMPRHETVYFTAVREPVTLLESAFNYFATGEQQSRQALDPYCFG